MGKFLSYWFCGCCLLAGMALAIPAMSPVAAQAGIAFRVQPERFSLSMGRGMSQENLLIIRNESDTELPVTLTVEPVARIDENAPVLLGSEAGSAIPREWVTLPQSSLVVPPRSARSVPFTVSLPEDTLPQDYIGALVFRAENETLIFEKGATLLIDVFDNGIEHLVIRDWSPASFLNLGNASFRYRLENTGDSFAKPYGTITLRNWGGTEVARIPINTETILPGKAIERIRKLELPLGVYTADLEIRYANDSKTATARTRGSVITGTFLVLVLLLIISGFIGYRRWRHTR